MSEKQSKTPRTDALDAALCEFSGPFLEESSNIDCDYYNAVEKVIAECRQLERELAAAQAKAEADRVEIDSLKAIRRDYIELIMEVGKKFHGETRHQTALRYIKQAETATGNEKDAAIDAARKK